MSNLKELLKEYGVELMMGLTSTAPLDRDELIKVYGSGHVKTYDSWRKEKPTWAYIEDCSCKQSHSIHGLDVGRLAYNWPGQSYLVANKPIPLETLHKLITVKNKELAAARKKRFETIKSARDAVRVTFRDLKIKHSMVAGSPRVDCGPIELEFAGDVDSPKVEVSFTYRSGYGGYLQKETLVELTVADPTFNNKVQAILDNTNNLKKLILGEIQPVSVNKAGL